MCSKYGQRPNEILTTNVLRCWTLLLPCRQLVRSWPRKGHSLLCHHTIVSQDKCPSQATYLLWVFLQSCGDFELCSLVRITVIQPQHRTWAQCLRDAYWQKEIICLEIGCECLIPSWLHSINHPHKIHSCHLILQYQSSPTHMHTHTCTNRHSHTTHTHLSLLQQEQFTVNQRLQCHQQVLVLQLCVLLQRAEQRRHCSKWPASTSYHLVTTQTYWQWGVCMDICCLCTLN